MRWLLLIVVSGACGGSAPRPSAPATEAGSPPPAVRPSQAPAASEAPRVHDVRITVLSTSKAPIGEGEWGFAALVEADGARILFDAGAKPKTVLRNAKAAGVDLTTIPQVVLSHHHDDHVGGLMTLRRSVAPQAPEALATVHVARGMFQPRRYGDRDRQVNDVVTLRPDFEQTGGRFSVHDEPTAIAPGVWVTGPVPRVHPERNWGGTRRIPGPDGRWVDDELHESQALVIDTDQGLVILSGCGHAGIVNIVSHAQTAIRPAPVRAAVGGFHLHRASDAHLTWTIEQLGQLGLESFYGAHCTGSKAVQRAAALVGDGKAREVGVGWTLTLPEGEPAQAP